MSYQVSYFSGGSAGVFMTDAEAPSRAEVALEVNPLSDRCRFICDQGDHALLGVSTGNSYFTRQRLTSLMAWASTRFSAVDVIYADLHVDAMFAAFGYAPEHARRRAERELQG